MNRSMFSLRGWSRCRLFCFGITVWFCLISFFSTGTLWADSAKRSGWSIRSVLSKKSETQTESDDSVQALGSPSVSRQSEGEAVAKIPWEALTPQASGVIQSLVQSRSLYRRLPMAGGYCNPEIYDFLLCHPEIVIGMWQNLGFSDVSIEKNGEGRYRLREKTGSVADVTVLYHDNKKMLLYCRGIYHGPLMAKPLQGETVVLLQYRFTEDANKANRPLTISRADCFIRIDNPGVDAVSRTFGPLIGKVVDANFVKTVEFVNSVSESAENNPEQTALSIQQIDGIQPAILDELSAIVLRASDSAELREEGKLVDYFLQPKPNAPIMAAAPLLSRKNTAESAEGTGFAASSYRLGTPDQASSPGISAESPVFVKNGSENQPENAPSARTAVRYAGPPRLEWETSSNPEPVLDWGNTSPNTVLTDAARSDAVRPEKIESAPIVRSGKTRNEKSADVKSAGAEPANVQSKLTEKTALAETSLPEAPEFSDVEESVEETIEETAESLELPPMTVYWVQKEETAAGPRTVIFLENPSDDSLDSIRLYREQNEGTISIEDPVPDFFAPDAESSSPKTVKTGLWNIPTMY